VRNATIKINAEMYAELISLPSISNNIALK
jgi:hypothetical protein